MLSKTDISNNALKVLNRLSSAGFQAYLVGGSVRDLLLGKVPKDFDVATNATPIEIRKLFRNGHIIGRRFKLVHVVFHRDIIEVATFRGSDEGEVTKQLTNEKGMLIRDNVYGTLEEDVWRRDFTINALYYNINDASIVDFIGGVNDIHNHTVRIIGNPDTRYLEDPVRMLRAIRFSAKLHFELAPETAEPLERLSHLIRHVSSSRLFEEVAKIYHCGEAETVQRLLVKHGLFAQLFTQTSALLNGLLPQNIPDDIVCQDKTLPPYPVGALLSVALENTDIRVRDNKPITPAFLFAIFLWFPLLFRAKLLQNDPELSPLPALEKAMSQIIFEQNQVTTIPKRLVQTIREIWLLQFRFSKRVGGRALNLLQHPRFRTAYDFMALRALAGDESMELAQWWTSFQEAPKGTQLNMIAELTGQIPKKKSRKRKKTKALSS